MESANGPWKYSNDLEPEQSDNLHYSFAFIKITIQV